MVGFMGSGYGASIGTLRVFRYNPATSAYDIPEHYDGFVTDSSGYANFNLANDNNGNMLFDGSQVFTYDAWNRLRTIAHGFRDAGGTLQTGQVFDQMSY